MQRRYVTVDVFTNRVFGGNPLAVVLDAEGLSAIQMQALAAEFNYAETTFVLPPWAAGHTAHVRIFTPRTEIPFAGHPNVGTGVVLARELEANGGAPLERLVFEEAAGLVLIRVLRDGDTVVGAELTAPAALALGSQVSAQDIAACLSRHDTVTLEDQSILHHEHHAAQSVNVLQRVPLGGNHVGGKAWLDGSARVVDVADLVAVHRHDFQNLLVRDARCFPTL